MIKMRYDLHTHSVFSDGKDAMEANIKAAIEKGLEKIGVTDHAYRHVLHGVRKNQLDAYLKEANRLKKKYKRDIEVLVGMEFNLLDLNGHVDIPKGYAKDFDLKLMGVHKATLFNDLKSFHYLLTGQAIKKFCEKADVVDIVTDAYIKALERYDIDILAHPRYAVNVDMKRLAETCSKTNTLVEINARHEDMVRSDVEAVLESGANFILDSDSHRSETIGVHPYADRFIKAHQIPMMRVVNAKES